MKVVYSLIILCVLSAIANATNHVNIEASGCIPDKYALGYVTPSNSGMTTNSTDPYSLYYLYCPVNFVDGQPISIIRQTVFGTAGTGSVFAEVFRMTNATGDIAPIGSVVCGVTSAPTTCSASMNYTPNAATETFWIQVYLAPNAFSTGGQISLVNVQLD